MPKRKAKAETAVFFCRHDPADCYVPSELPQRQFRGNCGVWSEKRKPFRGSFRGKRYIGGLITAFSLRKTLRLTFTQRRVLSSVMPSLQVLLLGFLVAATHACFCPSCGCGSGGFGGYGGASFQPQTVIWRDLTPFRQPNYYGQQQPMYPPQQYAVPFPQQQPFQPQQPYQQQFPQVAPRPYVQPQPQPSYISQSVSRPQQPQQPQWQPPQQAIQPRGRTYATEAPLYEQPAAPVFESNKATPEKEKVTYGEESAPEATVTTTTTEQPVELDFDETAPQEDKKDDKTEYYYVYYDSNGKKIGKVQTTTLGPNGKPPNTLAPHNGDVTTRKYISRSTTTTTTTSAPESEPEAVTYLESVTQTADEVTEEEGGPAETYDDLIEEQENPTTKPAALNPPAPKPEAPKPAVVVTQAPPSSYEEEKTDYADETQVEPEDTKENSVTPATNENDYKEKRSNLGNQILVDASDSTGEVAPYKRMVGGVKQTPAKRVRKLKKPGFWRVTGKNFIASFSWKRSMIMFNALRFLILLNIFLFVHSDIIVSHEELSLPHGAACPQSFLRPSLLLYLTPVVFIVLLLNKNIIGDVRLIYGQ
ncbi:unnamed protein product [Caenorhabditis auriculariae]|uniref:Uncharacterized protein n=1 Tax=Caenorhabditis auriculariae TaxID=2777116 RepID=A0A8S1I037_9PELO|nr:unnamed protein product [Caenorhabditis auriculariae]